ncbi:MAG: NAD(P)-binding domain-containing protein [Phycisphaeraceae bacterium]
MEPNQTETDVLIVGAGPIGLELAVVLKHMNVPYIQIDAGQVGQTISWYPKQVRFFSSPERIAIAGVPLTTTDQEKATREQYLAYLRQIVLQFGLPVHTYERVTNISPAGEGFVVTTNRRDGTHTYRCRYVVCAIGDMHKPRRLRIPGENLEHVSHYFDEPHRYFRQQLLIVGGRNSAVEAAIRCVRAGAVVTLSYRHTEFDPQSVKYWLLPEIKAMIRARQITYLPNTIPTRITPSHVQLADTDDRGQAITDSTVKEVPADFVLLMTGYRMDTSLLEQAGVELVGENRGPKLDPDTMMTNVPGLFVAGTAAAGTQTKFRLFIENCHPHVAKIAKTITGQDPPPGLINDAAKRYQLPES